jgi:RNA polymerase sigma factor (sigma-70 family)
MRKTWYRKLISKRFGTLQDFGAVTAGHGCVRDHSAFDEGIHSVGQSTPTRETSLIEKENAELVREALAELPLEYREVLVLRELEELSYLEIASITRIPLGTVMSRLSRARKRLQQSLLNLEGRKL